MRKVCLIAILLVVSIFVRAAEKTPYRAKGEKYSIKPTIPDVAYGKEHRKQVLHFWKAKSKKPTPVLIAIHGGAWVAGNRTADLHLVLKQMLDAGISVASVEYRFLQEAKKDKMDPPVTGPYFDAARAIQFVRSKAKEWNIDKERVAAFGASAGGCSSLWLAFHEDLAKPKSKDKVLRESTRLWCAAVLNAQTTLDPKQFSEWTPNCRYGGRAFGQWNFKKFLADRKKYLKLINEYSPYAQVTSDDPPVYLIYRKPPALGKEHKDPVHTSNYGVMLQKQCKKKGVSCELVYPGAPGVKHKTVAEYLIATLKASKAKMKRLKK